MSNGVQHFLDLSEFSGKELREILSLASQLKKKRDSDPKRPLAGRTLAMIFEKPSTRTRVSFDVA
ncbi:MAG: ornithine carbamoyltransferase, partial [Xanthobacteraceae bacterium]